MTTGHFCTDIGHLCDKTFVIASICKYFLFLCSRVLSLVLHVLAVPSAVKTQYRLWTPESYKCNLIYFIRSEINTIYTET